MHRLFKRSIKQLTRIVDSSGGTISGTSRYSRMSLKIDFGTWDVVCSRGTRGIGGIKCDQGDDISGDLGNKMYESLRTIPKAMQKRVIIPRAKPQAENAVLNGLMKDLLDAIEESSGEKSHKDSDNLYTEVPYRCSNLDGSSLFSMTPSVNKLFEQQQQVAAAEQGAEIVAEATQPQAKRKKDNQDNNGTPMKKKRQKKKTALPPIGDIFNTGMPQYTAAEYAAFGEMLS